MDGSAGDRAVSAGGKAHRETGRSGRAHAKVGITKRLVSQSAEVDRLISPGNRETLRHIGSRIVVRVPRLLRSDCARANTGDMDGSAGDGAVSAGGETHRESRTGSRAHAKVSIT